jgi:single-strand DNA-binding protein
MASRSVNKVILIGNLGKDAETRFTPQGIARTTFAMATSRRWKDQQTGEWKEETDWHNVILWRSENVANYLTKGKKVYVEGRLQTRSYDDKDGNKKYMTEVVAEDVMLLGGRDDAGMGGGEPGGYSGGFAEGPAGGGGGGPVSMPRSAQQRRPAAAPAPAPAPSSGGDTDPFGDQGVTDDDVPF